MNIKTIMNGMSSLISGNGPTHEQVEPAQRKDRDQIIRDINAEFRQPDEDPDPEIRLMNLEEKRRKASPDPKYRPMAGDRVEITFIEVTKEEGEKEKHLWEPEKDKYVGQIHEILGFKDIGDRKFIQFDTDDLEINNLHWIPQAGHLKLISRLSERPKRRLSINFDKKS